MTYHCQVAPWTGLLDGRSAPVFAAQPWPEATIGYLVARVARWPRHGPDDVEFELDLTPDDSCAQPKQWLFPPAAPFNLSYPVIAPYNLPYLACGGGTLRLHFRLSLAGLCQGGSWDWPALVDRLSRLVPQRYRPAIGPCLELIDRFMSRGQLVIHDSPHRLVWGRYVPPDWYLAGVGSAWRAVHVGGPSYCATELLRSIANWCDLARAQPDSDLRVASLHELDGAIRGVGHLARSLGWRT